MRSWAVTAVMLALGAVVAVLLVPELRDSLVILVISLLVVVSGWSMVAYTFAVGYLRLHGGLEFPKEDRPVWADYVYLSPCR